MSPRFDPSDDPAPRRLAATLLLGAGAFALYGGWAAWANHDHGLLIASKAALTQGLMSFCFTVFITILMNETYRRLGSWPGRAVLTAIGPLTLVLSSMALVHAGVETPNILATIAPSAVIGFSYCMIYSWSLTRRQSPAMS